MYRMTATAMRAASTTPNANPADIEMINTFLDQCCKTFWNAVVYISVTIISGKVKAINIFIWCGFRLSGLPKM